MAGTCPLETSEGLETTTELDSRLVAAGVQNCTPRKWERWRNRRLLQEVRQVQRAGGSTVFHAADTFDRIRTIVALLGEKHDLAWVGRQMWWQGRFDMDEIHWRPGLQAAGQRFDQALRRVRRYVRRDRGGSSRTAYDRLAQSFQPDIVLSGLAGRLAKPLLASAIGIFTEVGLGKFDGLDAGQGAGDENSDAALAQRALDIAGGANHRVCGTGIGLIDALPSTLTALTTALRSGGLTVAANAPRREIDAARDDVRNCLDIAWSLHQATSWIYGPKAFGLAFAAWIAEKANDQLKSTLVLIWVLLRRADAPLCPSEYIAWMAQRCAEGSPPFLILRELSESDPRFKNILKPTRLKRAFTGEIAWPPVLEEIKSRVSECYGAGGGDVILARIRARRYRLGQAANDHWLGRPSRKARIAARESAPASH